jgi:RHS repeat-associated protein
MCVDGTLSYVLGDQLGSSSLTLSSAGAVTGQSRYYPFGETRVSTGNMPDDRLFAGQRAMADLGIYYYRARFYLQTLGRFLSADTVLPGAGNSQAYDRFAYSLGNPILYNDPSGHCVFFVDPGGCPGGMPQGGGGPPSELGESLSANEAEGVGSNVINEISQAEQVENPLQEASTESEGTGEAPDSVGQNPEEPVQRDPIEQVHGNSLDGPKHTYLYDLQLENGDHLKYGITSLFIPENRYTSAFMKDKYMDILDEGGRRAMHTLENQVIKANPRGDLQFSNH